MSKTFIQECSLLENFNNEFFFTPYYVLNKQCRMNNLTSLYHTFTNYAAFRGTTLKQTDEELFYAFCDKVFNNRYKLEELYQNFKDEYADDAVLFMTLYQMVLFQNTAVSYGQSIIDVDFNPSKNILVTIVKHLAAQMIDVISCKPKHGDHEILYRTNAITSILNAQMASVKSITSWWKEH